MITLAYGVLMCGSWIRRLSKGSPSVGRGDRDDDGYGVVLSTHSGCVVAAVDGSSASRRSRCFSGVVASVFVHRQQTTKGGPEIMELRERLVTIEKLLREKS